VNELEATLRQELETRLERLGQASHFEMARLELHRARVAAHAANHQLERFLEALELGRATPHNDVERVWFWAIFNVRTRAVFEQERRERLERISQLTGRARDLEAYRLRVAEHAMADHIMGHAEIELASQPDSVVSVATQVLRSDTTRRNKPEETVRVAVSRLDALLAQVGELTVGRTRLEERARALHQLLEHRRLERRVWRNSSPLRRRLENLAENNRDVAQLLSLFETREEITKRTLAHSNQVLQQLQDDLAQLKTVNAALSDEVLAVRLLPAATLFAPLERLVRDLGQQLGKSVRLETSGGEIGVDRKILEGLRDPLMHMVRNALDHGLESPQERQRVGKSETGVIQLGIASSGAFVTIKIADDGRGMTPEKLIERAREKGIDTQGFNDSGIFELIFEPGFSTATVVTDVSGRGVGMDVVRQNVRGLGGTIGIDSRRGHGTTFTLRLPAQLATLRVFLVRVGHHVLAVPSTLIARVGRLKLELEAAHLTTSGDTAMQLDDQTVIIQNGEAVPVIELGALLEVPFETGERWHPYFMLRLEATAFVYTVDAMLGEQAVVVKKLGFPLETHPAFEGAAVLSDGQITPILSHTYLLERGLRRDIPTRSELRLEPQTTSRVPRILIVDDSVTSRALERSILEAAGFATLSAIDGAQALELLRFEHVDLVLTDVEMPEMDGFALTAEIRRDPRLAQLPVILVTSLSDPGHRELGAQAGADAYIIKGEFDQTALLETIERLL
jgi:two-component system, chemotaxis family, sensor kinase CheA